MKYYFYNPEEPEEEQPESAPTNQLIHPSTGWTPPSGQERFLEGYRSQTLHDLEDELTKSRPVKYNTTFEERKSLQTLRRNEDIIIKPADKGGSIVIMNKEDYIKEANRQLDNRQHYRKLYTDPTIAWKQEIDEILQAGEDLEILTPKERKNIITKHPRTSSFYMLPKIHKINNPGRPIVNSIGSITEKISAYVDEMIQPLAQEVTSYIKDTTHFLNVLNTIQLEDTDLLVTIDVSSLYTNIPHEEGIAAMKQRMTEKGYDTNTKDLITKLARKVLTRNYFTFNNQLYHQVQGTAMGTRMAPNYAIIFMHQLETSLLNNYHLKPKVWKRFIDDIFMIWNHGAEELDTFLAYLNNAHPTIKFTSETSNNSLSFLDTWIYIENDELHTRVYHKPTDDKQYLHYSSAHPLQQKNSIPYSLLLRAKRICTKQQDYEDESKSIINKLVSRGYPRELLNSALEKVNRRNRLDLLTSTHRIEPTERTRCITTYNNNNPNLKDILMRHTPLLLRTKKPAFNIYEPQVVFRRNKNLRDILVSANLSMTKTGILSQPCRNPCVTCPHMESTMTIKKTGAEDYKIRGNFTCQSTNAVYCMECKTCGMKYVGETSNTINTRFRGHETAIRNQHDNPVAHHFNQHQNPDYTIIVLDREENKNKRLRLEEAWMTLLNTIHPSGINVKL